MKTRIPEPHLPSFTLALTRGYDQYPMRLPAYRSAYQLRYHPYAGHPSLQQDNLMVTVDYRYGDHDFVVATDAIHADDEAKVDLQATICEDNTTAADLAAAMSTGSNCSPTQRRGLPLSQLIVDLLLMVRLKLRGLKVVTAKVVRAKDNSEDD